VYRRHRVLLEEDLGASSDTSSHSRCREELAHPIWAPFRRAEGPSSCTAMASVALNAPTCVNAGACRLPSNRQRSGSVRGPSGMSARRSATCAGTRLSARARQGLTLVHFSAQPEPFLTQNTP